MTQAQIGLIPWKKMDIMTHLSQMNNAMRQQDANINLLNASTEYKQKQIKWLGYDKVLGGVDRFLNFRGQNINFLKSLNPFNFEGGQATKNIKPRQR